MKKKIKTSKRPERYLSLLVVLLFSAFFHIHAQKFPEHIGGKVKELHIIKTDTSYEKGEPVFTSDTSFYQYNANGDMVKYKAGFSDFVYIYKYNEQNRIVYYLKNFNNDKNENFDSCAFTYQADGSGYYLSWNLSFAGIPDSITFDSHGNELQNFRNNKLQNSIQYTYDKNGCLLKTSNNDKTLATFTCNEMKLPATGYSINSAVTTKYFYDVNGLLKTEYSKPEKDLTGTRSVTQYYYTF